MEKIAAVSNVKAANHANPMQVLQSGEQDLFAAFIMNVDSAQDQNAKPEQKAAPKAEQNDSPKPAHADKAEQPHKHKAKDKVEATDKGDDKPVAKADKKEDAPAKADAADSDDKAAKCDAPAPVETKAEVKIDANVELVVAEDVVAPVAEQAVVEVAAPEVKAEAKVEAAVIVAAPAPVEAKAQPVIKLSIADNDDEDDSSEEESVGQALSALERKLLHAPQASDRAQERAAANSAVGRMVAAAEAQNTADVEADAEAQIDVKLPQLAVEAKHGSNKNSESAAIAAEARHASPLLPGQSLGPNQLASVQNGAQLGASSAASQSAKVSLDADAIARPLGVLAQQEGSKVVQAKLARLSPTALTQVQEQVAIKLRYAAKAGEKSLTLKLHPEELGRVDVKLEFKEGNQVSAKVFADNQFTLDLLQKDKAGLERALNDAGLKLDAGGMQFEMRQGNGEGRGFDLREQGGWSSSWKAETEKEINLVAANDVVASNGINANGRVDISV